MGGKSVTGAEGEEECGRGLASGLYGCRWKLVDGGKDLIRYERNSTKAVKKQFVATTANSNGSIFCQPPSAKQMARFKKVYL
jgi:hypothetical protein